MEEQTEDPFELPLSICIRNGMSYEDSWNYTLAELLYMAQVYQENEQNQVKHQLAVAHWHVQQIALAIHEPKKMTRKLEDDFPELFTSKQVDDEEVKWERFKALAVQHNQSVKE